MNSDISTLFVSSNEAYNHGDYATAIKGYDDIISQKPNLPDVYLNLGNAHMKSQHLGQAVYYYKKALSLSPRDPDIRYNLKYAHEKTVDKIDSKSAMGDMAFPFTSGEFLIFLALCSVVMWSSQLILLYKKWAWPKMLRNIFAFLFILAAIPYSLTLFKNNTFGVVTAPEVNIYSAIGKDKDRKSVV